MAIIISNLPNKKKDGFNILRQDFVMQTLASGDKAKHKPKAKQQPFSSRVAIAKIRMSPHYRQYIQNRQNHRYNQPIIDYDNYKISIYYPEKIRVRESGIEARYARAKFLSAKAAAAKASRS